MKNEFTLGLALLSPSIACADNMKYDGIAFAQYAAEWEAARGAGDLAPNAETLEHISYFTGFVNGVVGSQLAYKTICLPERTHMVQIWAVVAKFLRNHPEHWNLHPYRLAESPVRDAFPCSTEP